MQSPFTGAQQRGGSNSSFVIRIRKTHTQVHHRRHFQPTCVMLPYACILTGQAFTRRYILTAMYSLQPHFMRRNFVVCRHVSGKLWCAVGKKRFQNMDVEQCFPTADPRPTVGPFYKHCSYKHSSVTADLKVKPLLYNTSTPARHPASLSWPPIQVTDLSYFKTKHYVALRVI
jgi:hypothetical protein